PFNALGRRCTYHYFHLAPTCTGSIDTLSLHDALPISPCPALGGPHDVSSAYPQSTASYAASAVEDRSAMLAMTLTVPASSALCRVVNVWKACLPTATSSNRRLP